MIMERVLLGTKHEGDHVIVRLRKDTQDVTGLVGWKEARLFANAVLQNSIAAERVARFSQ